MGNVVPIVTDTKPATSLVLSEDNYKTKEVTVPSGTTIARYTAVGLRTVNTTIATPAVVGTGNGLMSNISSGKETKVGDYIVKCVRVATDAGLFEVLNPDKKVIGSVEAGSSFSHPEINFDIADGSTDFVAGDTFTIAVGAGDGKCIAAVETAVDGSNHIVGFAPEEIDASAADTLGLIVERGLINETLMVVDGSYTVDDTFRKTLADDGLVLEKSFV